MIVNKKKTLLFVCFVIVFLSSCRLIKGDSRSPEVIKATRTVRSRQLTVHALCYTTKGEEIVGNAVFYKAIERTVKRESFVYKFVLTTTF